jgi:hypothetical protein
MGFDADKASEQEGWELIWDDNMTGCRFERGEMSDQKS